MEITLTPNSMLARIYGQLAVQERYYCNFGVNPKFADALRASELKIVAADEEGEVRAVELSEHPFFVGTLFQPQLSSTLERPHPVISTFLKAAAQVAVS